jgi:hypothetical protein
VESDAFVVARTWTFGGRKSEAPPARPLKRKRGLHWAQVSRELVRFNVGLYLGNEAEIGEGEFERQGALGAISCRSIRRRKLCRSYVRVLAVCERWRRVGRSRRWAARRNKDVAR